MSSRRSGRDEADSRSPDGTKRLRVLVVDDDHAFCAAAEAVLQQNERVRLVGCAHDGARALELAAALEPDLVLLGIKLPLLDGLDVADSIHTTRPETRIVIVTGSEDDALREAARTAGAAAFLKKDASLFENLDLTLSLVELASPPWSGPQPLL